MSRAITEPTDMKLLIIHFYYYAYLTYIMIDFLGHSALQKCKVRVW